MGKVVATQGVLSILEMEDIIILLARHSGGDWGELTEGDKEANKKALTEGGRIFSSYKTDKGKVWIITEADRSSTCLLLPEEY